MAQPKAASAAAQLSLATSACIAGTIDVYCSIENASFIVVAELRSWLIDRTFLRRSGGGGDGG